VAVQLFLQIIAVNPVQKVCDIIKRLVVQICWKWAPIVVSYHFYRPEDAKAEAKVWEVLVLTLIIEQASHVNGEILSVLATMAKHPYFEPFRHAVSNQTFSDNDSNEENPIFIADSEFRNTYSDIPVKFPDVLASIGTGSKLEGNQKKFSSSNKIPMTEAVCNDYLSSLPSTRTPRERFIRLNPILDQLPEYDDLASLKNLQRLVSERIDFEHVRKLASQLFATLFYFEKLDVVDEASGDNIILIGEIKSAVPNSFQI